MSDSLFLMSPEVSAEEVGPVASAAGAGEEETMTEQRAAKGAKGMEDSDSTRSEGPLEPHPAD